MLREHGRWKMLEGMPDDRKRARLEAGSMQNPFAFKLLQIMKHIVKCIGIEWHSSRVVTCALGWAVHPALFAGKLQDENVVAKDYYLVSSLLVMPDQEPCYGHLRQDESTKRNQWSCWRPQKLPVLLHEDTRKHNGLLGQQHHIVVLKYLSQHGK